MISLKQGAKITVSTQIKEDSIIEYWREVCDNYTNRRVQVFITNLQNLITKIGIIISIVDNSNIKISSCYQSIHYLCTKVLDNPSLEKNFDSLGLNNKANKGKHDIITNKIDMDRTVSIYNGLINSIVMKYDLPALNDLLIRKSNNQNAKQPDIPKKNHKKVQKVIVQNDKTKKPVENITTNDEHLMLNVELLKGEGKYTKGLFTKKDLINFKLKVSIDNPDFLKIKKITASIKCNNNTEEIILKNDLNTVTDIDLESSKFYGNIKATVTVYYKISFAKTKQIKTTVSKNF